MKACLPIIGDEHRAKPSTIHGSNLGFDTKPIDVRTVLNNSGDGDGCPRACFDSLSRKGSTQRDVGEDQMDLEEENGDKAAV